MSGIAHTPNSNEFAFVVTKPGMFTVNDAEKKAGNSTETRLIRTIIIENKKTAHEVKFFDL